jgi:two-component system, response regulator RegA
MVEELGAEGTVLVVESCPLQSHALTRFLSRYFEHVISATTLAEARKFVRSEKINCSVIELDLPDGRGLQLVPILRSTNSAMRIIILTAHGSIASTVDAIQLGADDYLTKPSSFEQVVNALRGHAAARRSQPDRPRPLSLERIKWEHIQRVLAESQWNISEAARRLGVHRQSLQRTLRKPPAISEGGENN